MIDWYVHREYHHFMGRADRKVILLEFQTTLIRKQGELFLTTKRLWKPRTILDLQEKGLDKNQKYWVPG